jgi:uncharacterized protein involved in exopolysaccharide biosynthesis
MQKNIHMRLTSDKSRFVLEFDYPDQRVAQQVDDELVRQMIVQVQNQTFSTFLKKDGEQMQERMKSLQGRLRLAKSAEEVNDVRSEIRETQAAQAIAARYRPLTLESVRLKAASFPQRPSGLSRTQLGLCGLFGGLLCGLSLTTARTRLRARRP